MSYKILVTAKNFSYNTSGYAGHQFGPHPDPSFSHNFGGQSNGVAVAIEIVEFMTLDEAEYAVTQIAGVGHTATRLYRVPADRAEYWVPNIPTGI